MKKLKKLVVANWKMNPQTREDAKRIAGDIKRGLRQTKTQVVICPPFVFIEALEAFPKGNFFLGSQDAFYENVGPFTGEVSYSQLLDFNLNFVIIGHSEKRKVGETDEIVNKKIKNVLNSKLNAILCVGEKERDNHGEYLNFVKKQLMEGLKDISKKSLDRLVVAYEPVWAIGAKEAMRARDIQEMSIYIKKVLRDMFGILSDGVRILYGASVMEGNADQIIREGGVSGLLVGRESLKPKDFVKIVKLVDSI